MFGGKLKLNVTDGNWPWWLTANARQDFGEGGPIGDVGIAEIALQQPADPTRVLHRHRLVEAEVLHHLRLLGRVDEACGIEQDVGDVARCDPQHHENDHRYPEQCQVHQAETAHQIGSHALSPSPVHAIPRGSPREDSMPLSAGRSHLRDLCRPTAATKTCIEGYRWLHLQQICSGISPNG
jgi:hypothetical protein